MLQPFADEIGRGPCPGTSICLDEITAQQILAPPSRKLPADAFGFLTLIHAFDGS
jgi:hypothetical protein